MTNRYWLTALAASCLMLDGCDTAGSSGAAVTTAPGWAEHLAGDPGPRHILVDQFGYRPNDPKVAVIRNPSIGYDHDDHFTPGAHYEVRRAADQSVAFAAAPVPWNQGAVQASSGDSGWWFDFSALSVPGKYYVYDPAHQARSAPFVIDQTVYRKVLEASMRMFFYQRSGFAKKPPFAQSCWADSAAYLGPDQDSQAHDVTDRNNPAKVRDMSGGWFDAGDTDKYVSFAAQPVHQLLSAYQINPAVFTDDYNIPESGNGIPDLIDEVKWETDWFKKMQFADGSVAAKLGNINITAQSPPSSDHSPRFYVPACTSATISAAGVYAHAALVFASFPALSAEAGDLRSRAIRAWNNYQSIPEKQIHCDTGVVQAGNADISADEQAGRAAESAIYLFALTGDDSYAQYLRAHYTDMHPFHDVGWSRYMADQGDALLFYTTLPNADADLKRKILEAKRADVAAGNQVYGEQPQWDLYRAYLHDAQYHWGSNAVRANYGNSNLDLLNYHVGGADTSAFTQRALDTLHYFHGVNPFGMVYLSNMGSYGATFSADEIFHRWFQPNTPWSDARSAQCGPAPGYLPGGPNASAVRDGVPASLIPPAGQPAQKSYRDWNANWPEDSWVVNEPGIYYQSSYVKLLSQFAR